MVGASLLAAVYLITVLQAAVTQHTKIAAELKQLVYVTGCSAEDIRYMADKMEEKEKEKKEPTARVSPTLGPQAHQFT